ncbi:MAG: hypothetical protein IJJ26_00680 [Victivallales bacterium]|nr:hypothetical protein [Victivallales bacterium]
MKKCLLVLAMLCGVLFAEDVLLLDVLAICGPKVAVWCEKGFEKNNSFENGVLRLEVVKNDAEKKTEANCQAMFIPGKRVYEAGKTYRVDFTFKSSKAFQSKFSVMMNPSPWTRLCQDKTLKLQADQEVSVSLEFKPETEVTEYVRVPNFCIGNAPAGTVVEISKIQLFEVK